MSPPPFAAEIFSGRPESLEELRRGVDDALSALSGAPPPSGPPFVGSTAEELAARFEPLFEKSLDSPSSSTANAILKDVVAACVPPFHPSSVAHLHTPVLNSAVKAEVVIAALNQSMDSLDQSGIATVAELRVLDWLAKDLVGLEGPAVGGTFTSGGTMSNYFATLLALHTHLTRVHGWDVRTNGLPPELLPKLRVLTSGISHFSIEKAVLQLGLGTRAVVKVPVDPSTFRIDVAEAERIAADLVADGLVPFLIVATASTTDFGSFDPLEPLAAIAQKHNCWFHVDAAYGSACLLSRTLRGNLAGIGKASSVTLDFHKAFFQPVSCGALLVADSSCFSLVTVLSDYLNSEARLDAGIPDLVNYSLMTTRRFDALKLIVSIAEIGLDAMAKMVYRLFELARWAHDEMLRRQLHGSDAGDLHPLHEPEFGCLVFRFIPRDTEAPIELVDAVNKKVPETLFDRGTVVLGHTKVEGIGNALKLTLNNPAVLEEELSRVLDAVQRCGGEEWERIMDRARS
ncbi:L-2,4-diaminobutyrate decarboxylase [Hyaloraphidium curvatum]|nr:L-2,4-diaminobutyrate decarboxylase [Hyaloraphidium curvatum]